MSLWVDTALPLVVGALCALIVIGQGGAFWTLPVVPALCWCVWQLARRFERPLVVRALLVTSLTTFVLVYFFLFLRVDTAKLYKAVSDAGIPVKTVSSDQNAVVISIQLVSWGPERNNALRAIFAAAHAHAKSKKRVVIQWGDAMTTTVKMKDIEQFIAGHVTYREMLNRMDWSGTPDVLPGDSTSGHDLRRISRAPALLFNDGQL